MGGNFNLDGLGATPKPSRFKADTTEVDAFDAQKKTLERQLSEIKGSSKDMVDLLGGALKSIEKEAQAYGFKLPNDILKGILAVDENELQSKIKPFSRGISVIHFSRQRVCGFVAESRNFSQQIN